LKTESIVLKVKAKKECFKDENILKLFKVGSIQLTFYNCNDTSQSLSNTSNACAECFYAGRHLGGVLQCVHLF
jgi:hypothetical protein